MTRTPHRFALALVCTLMCVAVFVWAALFSLKPSSFTVTFLDVGQGDAIFIESPSGRQMLIDGGRDGSVLRELGEVMPWHDRSIDVVLVTHFDADHSAGLIPVLERFSSSYFFIPTLSEDDTTARALLSRAEGSGAIVQEARRGDVIDLGNGVRVQILFPDRDTAGWDANTSSVIAQVSYGEHEFLLTGDAPVAIEKYLLSLDNSVLESDVLKAGHHGSHTSSDELFVGYVNPAYVVFSRGCGNSYGHPHEDVVSRFEQFGVTTYDTCTDGRVVFTSDGRMLRKY